MIDQRILFHWYKIGSTTFHRKGSERDSNNIGNGIPIGSIL